MVKKLLARIYEVWGILWGITCILFGISFNMKAIYPLMESHYSYYISSFFLFMNLLGIAIMVILLVPQIRKKKMNNEMISNILFIIIFVSAGICAFITMNYLK